MLQHLALALWLMLRIELVALQHVFLSRVLTFAADKYLDYLFLLVNWPQSSIMF